MDNGASVTARISYPNVGHSCKTTVSEVAAMDFVRLAMRAFVNNSFPGREKAEATSDIPESKKMEVERRFFIGPVAKKEFWDKERAVLDMDQGPSECFSITLNGIYRGFHVVKHCNGYLKAIAQREITWISRYATPKEQDLPENPEAQHSSDAHIELYEKFLSVFDYLFRMTTG
ncbi:Phosphotransferase enzyme [Aspergillus alliaceus]|uniref:Phosphotransferase enzyme n=1 Tax=Petromyces alliaceus TaxID=209559 RepID=A0A8H6E489_PETAA|nr:Phosphotransferase enzyme [Aspergillus burnettii]